ncbi:hypothetical protein V6N13_059745 [Hibiscus sabdariffa]
MAKSSTFGGKEETRREDKLATTMGSRKKFLKRDHVFHLARLDRSVVSETLLATKGKQGFLIVIPLQVIANIAQVFDDEAPPFCPDKPY